MLKDILMQIHSEYAFQRCCDSFRCEPLQLEVLCDCQPYYTISDKKVRLSDLYCRILLVTHCILVPGSAANIKASVSRWVIDWYFSVEAFIRHFIL